MEKHLSGPTFSKLGNGATAVIAFGLGLTGGLGLGLTLLSGSVWEFGAFLLFLAAFHFSEYICVALFNPATLTTDSFLVNHSREYSIAIAASLGEFFIESLIFPGAKGLRLITCLGLLIALSGFVIRIVALVTAAHNFTHDIAETKRDEHVLVTEGIYKIMRHPGYMGWFWFSVGTQILLVNPICTAGFAYASYIFFKDRIEHEEKILVEFFGEKYQDYRKRTPTYIPLIA